MSADQAYKRPAPAAVSREKQSFCVSRRRWESRGAIVVNFGETTLFVKCNKLVKGGVCRYDWVMLDADLLLTAYRQGVFPMAVDRRGKIGWFSPDPRAIIPLDERFHIPHGLERVLRKKKFELTVDRDFEAVIRACSKTHGDTWISEEIIEAYCQLHRLGFAHSMEVRLAQGDNTKNTLHASTFPHSDNLPLVGGLYGVHSGGAFFGESMFHHATDASKVALVALVERLRERGFLLLDTQWITPHLARFGTVEIPRSQYLRLLKKALAQDCVF